MNINSNSKRAAGSVLAVCCATALTLGAGDALFEVPGFGAVAHAAPGGGKGPPSDKGPGGGGNPSGKGDTFADLLMLYRMENALPLNADGTEVSLGECIRPVSDVIDGSIPPPVVTNPADGRQVSLIPLVEDLGQNLAESEDELEPCDIQADYLPYAQETGLDRLNAGRSPKVLDQALKEVKTLLSSATDVELDPAGRLVVDGFTIDSPVSNLAIYRELMSGRALPAALPLGDEEQAASALGAATGKGERIDVDTVAYLNRVLGIPGADDILSGTGEYFLDYSNFTYSRAKTYPGEVEALVIERDELGNVTNTYDVCGDILDVVLASGFTGMTGIHQFAQRADDTRAVVNYMHSNVIYQMHPMGESEPEICP